MGIRAFDQPVRVLDEVSHLCACHGAYACASACVVCVVHVVRVACVCTCVYTCMCTCVRACMRTRVRACTCAHRDVRRYIQRHAQRDMR